MTLNRDKREAWSQDLEQDYSEVFPLCVVKREPAKKAAQEKKKTREVENAGPEEKSLANSLADLGNPGFGA